MKFKSKVDWWMWGIFWAFTASTIFVSYAAVFEKVNAVAAWVCVVALWLGELLLMIPTFAVTYYLLREEGLFVRCGLFRQCIRYGRILSVKETKSPLASLALSLDRIEIKYWTERGTMGEAMISPRHKDEFMRLLNELRMASVPEHPRHSHKRG
ncbi:MAG: PH domain-containing protein [Coriobacteriales bacterium]|jgi:hypothetical protein|nr:PH domain-containing protein [Coriobacteriales bacterium]